MNTSERSCSATTQGKSYFNNDALFKRKNHESCHLYLIRHGQTDWNAEQRLQGRIDRSLDEIGRGQAAELAQWFSALPLGGIYSSTLARAAQTAQMIAHFHALEIIYRADLVEGAVGKAEGMKIADYHREFSDILGQRKRLSAHERFHRPVVEGAESAADIVARVVPALEQIANAHRDQNVIVVTHGWVIRSLLTFLAGYDDLQTSVNNGGIILIEGSPNGLKVIDQHIIGVPR